MRNFKILYLLLLSCCLGFAQIKQDFIFGEVRNSTDGQSIADVNVVLKDSTAIFTTITDANGKFKFPKTTLSKKAKLEMSCIGFETKNFNASNQQIFYLNEKTEVLNTVLIKKETKKMSIIESLIPYERNLGFNAIAVNFFPFDEVNMAHKITKLRYHIIDMGGVKGLKYLPFKVNLYSCDSLGMPNEKILKDDILAKKDNNKIWFEIDISKYNIKIPKQGIYVAFIVLDKKDYKTQFIQSNFGVIQAVPSLKLRRTRDIRKKSYLGYNGEIPAKIKWEKMIARFEMELEYEK